MESKDNRLGIRLSGVRVRARRQILNLVPRGTRAGNRRRILKNDAASLAIVALANGYGHTVENLRGLEGSLPRPSFQASGAFAVHPSRWVVSGRRVLGFRPSPLLINPLSRSSESGRLNSIPSLGLGNSRMGSSASASGRATMEAGATS
ncbi:hypothetical protein U1Q18_027546 [Sarracenia purpurea var. burkii]